MNKGILLIILLTTATLVISGCATGPGSSEPQQSGIFSSALTGGKSSGPDHIIDCFSDEDCPMCSVAAPYCQEHDSCQERCVRKCVNPGEYDSYCDCSCMTICKECDYGCDEETGYCIEEEVTYEGILNMLEEGCILTFSGLYNDTINGTLFDGTNICDLYNMEYGKKSVCIFAQETGPINTVIPCNSVITMPNTIHVMCCETP